jgi:hypothetical protein
MKTLIPGTPGTTTAPVSADGVEWIRLKEIKPRFGMSQRTAERLIASNRIVSTALRVMGQKRGIRLISVASVRALLAGKAEVAK